MYAEVESTGGAGAGIEFRGAIRLVAVGKAVSNQAKADMIRLALEKEINVPVGLKRSQTICKKIFSPHDHPAIQRKVK